MTLNMCVKIATIVFVIGISHCEGDTWPGRKYVGKLLTTRSHVVVTCLSFGLPYFLANIVYFQGKRVNGTVKLTYVLDTCNGSQFLCH